MDDAAMAKLEKLASMKDSGILTEAEFATQKAALLAVAPQAQPPQQQQMPEFVPSATFAGAQPGYSFKNGPHGVGYYRDGRVAMQQPPPSQQNLQHHYPPPQQQQFPPPQQQQQYNTLGRRDLPPTMQGGRVPVQANERMVPDRPGTRGGMRVNAPSMQGGLFAKGVWS